MAYGSSSYGSQAYGGSSEGLTVYVAVSNIWGYITDNRVFSETPIVIPYTFALNASKHKPLGGTWEELSPNDLRIKNYNFWAYPHNKGIYTTPEIDLGKTYYGAKVNVRTNIRELSTNYTPESLQMNERGKIDLNIRGKCNILPPRTRYRGEFGASDPDQLALLGFKSFWVDNNEEYVYVYIATKNKHGLQKRRLSDLSIVAEVADTDIDITAIDDQSLGITGDSTSIYYTLQSSGWVAKRRQSDLILEAKANIFTTSLLNPLGIWADASNIYICDNGGDRIIKCNTMLNYVSQYYSVGSKPTRITGDSTNIYIHRGDNYKIDKITKSTMLSSGVSSDIFYQVTGMGSDGTNIYFTNLDGQPNEAIYSKITKMETTGLTVLKEITTLGSDNEQSIINIGMTGGAWSFATNTFGGYYNNKHYIIFRDTRIIDQMNVNLVWVAGSTLPAPALTTLFNPIDIAGDDDYIFICDYINNRLIKVDANTLSPLISYTATNFKLPYNICTDDLYVYCLALKGIDYTVHKFTKSNLTLVKTKTIENLIGYPDTPSSICNDSTNLYIIGSFGLIKIDKDFNLVATSIFGNNEVSNPTDSWTNGTKIYITNKTEFSGGGYKLSLFNNNLTFDSKVGLGNNLNNSVYGIYGEGTNTNGSFYISQFSFNNSEILRCTIASGTVSFDHSFGSFGVGKNNYNFPQGLFLNTKYLYISDSLNDRIEKRANKIFNRVKLTTDESMKDGLPNPQNDYYTGYKIILRNHPDSRPILTKREITNYGGITGNVSVDSNNPFPINQELNNINYKMIDRSQYPENPNRLIKPPKIRIKTSDKNDLSSKSWEMWSPQKTYDSIRYYQIKVQVQNKDAQTNVELNDIKSKIRLTHKMDMGERIGISSAGTKVAFNIRFNNLPKIKVKTYTSASAVYETIENRSLSQTDYPPYGGFTVIFRDNTGMPITNSTISWEWEAEEF